MHDLGKIAVDDVVLRKSGKFTDEEFAKMKQHAARDIRRTGSFWKVWEVSLTPG
ncbi:MAG: hypothetical protein IJ106_00940 [Parasporobacterium sp.]|nr:hypothetical protein [Parasporobacterium sp.]